MNKRYTADFETCTWLEDETYVWAWAICDIDNSNNLYIGTEIDDFMNYCMKSKNATFLFHNLKFDGEFIIYWLLTHDFKWVESKKEVSNNTFTTLINDMGVFYAIEVYWKKSGHKVVKATFYDSLKIIPFSVDETAKAFNLPISKLKIDYNQYRERGHELTNEEIDYITNDVAIMAQALKVIYDEGLTKMTRASNAMHDFKTMFGSKDKFEHYFPKLDFKVDEQIRKCYKGGFTYLNPIYENQIVENVNVLDVNSLYPSVMACVRGELMPYGEPLYFEGRYKPDPVYPLYVQSIRCSFEIKKNKIPTVQIKNQKFFFTANEYLESSKGEEVVLTMTNIDLELFLSHYDTFNLTYIDGWKFKGASFFFKDYINKWTEKKIQAGKSGNKGQRQLAKLMLNSLYGKFAMSLKMKAKSPFINEEGIVRYKLEEEELSDGMYLPVGSFITSYARKVTIETSQKIKEYSINKYGKDMYIYSDTDSIHTCLSIEELKKFCDIDDFELGKWAHEATATRGKFLRQKCYIEEIDGELKITCAGMPKKCVYFHYNEEGKKIDNTLYYKDLEGKEHIFNIDDFKVGFTCSGKLTFEHIKGGVRLIDTDFTIKDSKIIDSIKSLL